MKSLHIHQVCPLNAVSRTEVCCAVVIASICLVGRETRADALINFDDLPNLTSVNNQYVAIGGSGIQFNGVPGFPGFGAQIVSGVVTPNSSPNVLVSSPLALEQAGGPLRATFLTPQKTVSLVGGYVLFSHDPLSRQGTLRGFDQNGVVIPGAVDGPKAVVGGATSAPFSISSSQATIVSFELDLGQFVYTTIDDLRFGGGATITPPSGPPTVAINAPAAGTADFVNGPLTIGGTVAGQALLSSVNVVLQLTDPAPGAIVDVVNGPAPLTNAGAFSTALPAGTLIMGTYILTVTATNRAGETGSASVMFTNLPSNVNSGGSLGAFHFAEQAAGGCQIAFFDDGGLAVFPEGSSDPIPLTAAVASKWLATDNYPILRGDGRLGCPLSGHEVAVSSIPLAMGDVEVQDFVRGRIYVNYLSTPPVAYYSPRVFAEAITAISTYTDSGDEDEFHLQFNDQLPPQVVWSLATFPPLVTPGFVNNAWVGAFGLGEMGMPTGDPVMNMAHEDPTWLFQRFQALGPTSQPANTIEVRGPNPAPTLFIERVGGSAVDRTAAFQSISVPPTIVPTVWEDYPCQFDTTFDGFKCPVTRPHIRALGSNNNPGYTGQTQIDNLDAYCDFVIPGTADPLTIPAGGTSWSAVPLKTNLGDEPSIADFTDVLTKGWIHASHAAGEDLSTDHLHMHGSTGDTVAKVAGTILGCTSIPVISSLFGPAIGCAYGEVLGEAVSAGWADWNLDVRPLALATADPNAGLLRLPAIVQSAPPFWDLLAAEGDPTAELQPNGPTFGVMEIEWEDDWGEPIFNIPGNRIPALGSIVILNGRWIVDCAHPLGNDPRYHAEIHPPNTIITLEASVPQAGMFLKEDTGKPDDLSTAADLATTRAQIWVNEFYEGEPFQTDIWPPPRPTEDSELSALYVDLNGLPGGTPVPAADGSLAFSFVNDPAVAAVPGPTSTATSKFVADGLVASFAGPIPPPSCSANGPPGPGCFVIPFGHEVDGTGQAWYPPDAPDEAIGQVGSYVARWYVGWTQ